MLLASMSLYAGNVTLSSYEHDIITGKDHRSPILLPEVFHNVNVLEVTNNCPLEHVNMVIRSIEGDVLYSTIFNTNSSGYCISLSDEIVEEMYSIELLYDNIHLIGYFN